MRLHRTPSEKGGVKRDIPRDIRVRQPVRKILRVLNAFEAVGTTAYNLQRETGLPRATLNRWLKALVREGIIKHSVRGIYVYVRDEYDITSDPGGEYGVHGLVLTTTDETSNLLPTVARRLSERPDARPFETGRWLSVYEGWKGRVVEIRIYRTGTLNIYVPATRKPMKWEEVAELTGWLTALLNPFDPGLLWVVQIGVHADHRGWTMKACKALSFEKWKNGFHQWYEKTEKLRREIHIHQRPGVLSLANAATIMAEGSPENKALKAEQLALHRLELELAQERLRIQAEIEVQRLQAEKAKAELETERLRRGPSGPSPPAPPRDGAGYA